jgi:hypothetical protein
MKQAFYFIILFWVFTAACNSDRQTKKGADYQLSETQLRELLKDTMLPKSIMVSSGQFSPCKTILIGSCMFDMVLKGTDTVYLATNDTSFITPEGFRVGAKFSALPLPFITALQKEPGWGILCTTSFKMGLRI